MVVLVGCGCDQCYQNQREIALILNTYSGPVESGFTLECYTIIKSISCHYTLLLLPEKPVKRIDSEERLTLTHAAQ